MTEADENRDLENCIEEYSNFSSPVGEIYCNWTWDSVLCWPPTKAGSTARQSCPPRKGVDPTKFAFKRCSLDGRWEGRSPDDFSLPQGWTNYTPCFTPEILGLMKKLYSGSEGAPQVKLAIASRTRTLEIIGLSVSLCALLLSLMVFYYFRSLKNNRTRIHKNLFIAMVIQVIVRLVLYVDQAIVREGWIKSYKQGIDNTPILCESSYVLLEYARTAMFMWMFVEGLYLHNMITVTVFQEKSHYIIYTVIGWGVPVLMTAVWAVFTSLHYGLSRCWWGYNLTLYFWILEGPRLGVIIFNFIFLLNVIRVLVVKMRQSHTSEMEQIRKAVRAALVLLPLLGITNLMNMTQAPLEKSVWEFAAWSYTTHFLTSFQGFFIAFLYCFMNGEVRVAVKKSLATYRSLRQNNIPRRNSTYSSVYITEVSDSNPGTLNCFRVCQPKVGCCANKMAAKVPAPETRV